MDERIDNFDPFRPPYSHISDPSTDSGARGKVYLNEKKVKVAEENNCRRYRPWLSARRYQEVPSW